MRTQVRILKSCILCQILHSAPYFFISLFPIAFYHRSRMTGRYLIPFCIKSPFTVLLTLTPFVSSADTLAKAKRLTHFYSVDPLLEKWFACFPTSGDSLRFAYFPCFPISGDGFSFAFSLYFQTHRGRFFVCVISLFFVFSILIFLFSGVKISVFFLKTDISFIFILLLYQLYCKPKNIFS